MTMDDGKFFAWLDGELPPAEAEAVAAEVAADPVLAAKADAHRAMQQRLAAAFAPIVAVPARPASNVVDLSAVRARRRGLPSAMQWAAMAATLAVGLVTGTMIARQPTASGSQGAILASASLDQALQSQLAADATPASARIGLTFRNRDGAICRTFTAAASQGLACRRDGDWEVRALVPAGEGQQGDIRMAAGPDPALASIIDRTIAGEPFDAAQEKAARDDGWR